MHALDVQPCTAACSIMWLGTQELLREASRSGALSMSLLLIHGIKLLLSGMVLEHLDPNHPGGFSNRFGAQSPEASYGLPPSSSGGPARVRDLLA